MIRPTLLLAAALLAGVIAIATAGCGGRVRLGGSEAGQSRACMNASCGAPCTGPDMKGHCTSDGSCVPDAPDCSPPPCLDQPCGTSCMPTCTNEDPGCNDPHECDGMGACVPGPLVCPCIGPDCPCDGKPCGAPCDPCSPMDPTCTPPQTKTTCDGMSNCVPAMSSGCPPLAWHPCAQAPCGAHCELCPPGDPMCMEPPGPKSCDDMGSCVMGIFTCAGDDGGAPDGGP